MSEKTWIHNYTLGKTIKNYGFFSYAVNEALHLSEQEKEIIMGIFNSIQHELSSSIDNFSQDIIISQVEQLLNYSNRYYNRQFLTRKAVHNDMFEGIPSVVTLAEKLSVSQRYLSDMLRSVTGMNTQQYLQAKMIEKAQELLSTTSWTIAEIVYQLGFEYPQSFNKFFKKQTQVSPLDYRHSFN